MKYIVRVPVLFIEQAIIFVEVDDVSESAAEATVEKKVMEWFDDPESVFTTCVEAIEEDTWELQSYETSSPTVNAHEQQKKPHIRILEDGEGEIVKE